MSKNAPSLDDFFGKVLEHLDVLEHPDSCVCGQSRPEHVDGRCLVRAGRFEKFESAFTREGAEFIKDILRRPSIARMVMTQDFYNDIKGLQADAVIEDDAK